MRNRFLMPLIAGLAAGSVVALIAGAQAAQPHRHGGGHTGDGHAGGSHTGGGHVSAYAGQENRTIKTFSAQDIDDLENGRGWGLAKAAELNGIPGPAHLLEMKSEIGLTAGQEAEIRKMFDGMKNRAIPLGKRLIALERALNLAFARGDVDANGLRDLLTEIGTVQSELRYVHLAAHLGTSDVLSPPQIDSYNRLRGYDVADDREQHDGHH